jgi:hypothetical protein
MLLHGRRHRNSRPPMRIAIQARVPFDEALALLSPGAPEEPHLNSPGLRRTEPRRCHVPPPGAPFPHRGEFSPH